MPLHLLSRKSKTPGLVKQAADFEPIRIIEVEIGQPLPDVAALDEKTGRRYQRARCLVRLHTQPLGLLELQLEEHGVGADEYAAHIWGALSEKINELLRQDGLPAVTGYRVGSWMRYLRGDVATTVCALQQHGRPGVPPRAQTLLDFFLSFFVPMKYDYLDWRDPLPVLVTGVDFAHYVAHVLKNSFFRSTSD